MKIQKLYAASWNDYELIDAGGGKKLERWGNVITIRPEVQAYFQSALSFKDWENKAHVEFVPKGVSSGTWKPIKKMNTEDWILSFENLKFHLELTKFKHVGIFPEQSENWDYIRQNMGPNSRFLNLFAYTGAASLAARSKGAETLHVDSVKQLITWAAVNQKISDLEGIKWIHEDALKFVEREVKRGKKYDGIIMDPPAWGIGAKGEKWKLEDKLELLISNASQLLDSGAFLIMNTYSPTIKTKDLQALLKKFFPKIEEGVFELWMKTTTGKELYYGNGLRFRNLF